MKHRELARAILKDMGGEENIISMTHCLTRLRFELKNSDKADMTHLKKVRGVRGIIVHRGKYMVVIGTAVRGVYTTLRSIMSFKEEREREQKPKGSHSLFAVFFYALFVAGIVGVTTKILYEWDIVYINSKWLKTISGIAESGLYLTPLVFWEILMGKKKKRQICDRKIIYAPVKGRTREIPLRMADRIGIGVIIEPESDLFVSPVDGIIDNVSDCFNSFSIAADSGIELVIEIGEAETTDVGKFFKAFVMAGDRVRVGDPIVEIDKDAMEINGFDITTIVGIRNYERYGSVRVVTKIAQEQRPLIEISKNDDEGDF